MKIWQRYLFREIFSVFLTFLGCSYFIYTLIDYSLHMQNFLQDARLTFFQVFLYYIFEFIKRSDLLVPLAILITTIKVLFSCNIQGELTVLRASGLSLKKILQPFILFASFLTLFNYASTEWILPSSLDFVDQFQQKHWNSSSNHSHIYTLSLPDQSKLIYSSQNASKQLLYDVFWIRSADEIWHIKSLCYNPKQPMGFFVDRLNRENTGYFVKKESFEKYPFPLFYTDSFESYKVPISLENKKISALFADLLHKKLSPYEYPTALSYLLLKLTLPLLPLLVVIAITPFCINHSRSFPIFFTYTLGLFGFIAFFTLLDGAIILSKNEVISAFYGILCPFVICFSLFTYRYCVRVQ